MDTEKLIIGLIADYENHLSQTQAEFDKKLHGYHEAVAVREALHFIGEPTTSDHIEEIEADLAKLEFKIDRCKVTIRALGTFLSRIKDSPNFAQRFEKVLSREA